MFVIDASVSMGLPIDVLPARERALDDRIDRGDKAAREEYRLLLGSPKPKRLDSAKRLFADALRHLPSGATAGAVTFRSCTTVDTVGPVPRDGFPDLLRHVAGLDIERGGETAITQAIAAGRDMLAGAGGRLVLVTDGQETCRINPCLAHADAATEGIVIDVIDLTGTSALACLAEATGGRLYIAAGRLDVAGTVAFIRNGIDAACTR